MKRGHRMPFGAQLQDGGGVRFRLWAPAASMLVLEHLPVAATAWRGAAMESVGEGWFEAVLPDAQAADDYRFRLLGGPADGLVVPDPASRANPHDVHGASRVVDPYAYDWQHGEWAGRPWHEAVVYELHVGTFTTEGSFNAARARLAELAALGITAIELMPLAEFPGRRGWGYDGVLPFAPDASYGTPDELKQLVDTAHGLGLMVLLDVVYNHFGPDGNYLHAYCPAFFDASRATAWGPAINFDGPHSRTVRDFFIHNALYWVEEFGFDGLRLDAVHAIRDGSVPCIVEEICTALRQGPGQARQVHVVLENENNESRRLARDAQGRPLAATAQWNDDLHHAAHVQLTGETEGYYRDFAQQPLERFALALRRGFVYAGEPSACRSGQPRGEPCDNLPLPAFVSHLQTHDQIGNRALGERIDVLADPVMVQAARACLLLSPHVPMLFMGEEFAAHTPFLYFCDYGETELGRAVTQGRRAEFAGFAAFAGEESQAAIPDPNGEGAFVASNLAWEEREQPAHAAALRRTRALLAARRAHIVPRMAHGSRGWHHAVQGGLLRVTWRLGSHTLLHLLANFGQEEREVDRLPGRLVYAEGASPREPDAQRLRMQPGGVWAGVQDDRDD